MPKAIHAFTTPDTSLTIDLRHTARAVVAWLTNLVCPDAALLSACPEFRRLDAVLAATNYNDEAATDVAFSARQHVADRIANLRPTTDAGRRAKAAVAITILSELQPWQRDSEVMFALAAFQAEAGA